MIKYLLYLLLLCWLLPLQEVLAQAAFFDLSFGAAGKVILPSSAYSHGLLEVVKLKSDGKIVVAGTYLGNACVMQFLTDGVADSSFATNGIAKGSASERYMDVVIQPDGKILVVADTNSTASGADYYILRLNSDGTRDATFGVNGVVVIDLTGYNDYGTKIELQEDGKIVVLGKATTSIGVIRLHPDGGIDSSFGTGGKVLLATYGGGRCLAIAPDGKIVIGGQRYSGYELMAIRLQSDGGIDSSFNGTGMAYALVGDSWNLGNVIVVQADGKVIVSGSGTQVGSGGNLAVVRFNANGTLDSTYGTGGKVDMDINGGEDVVRAMVLRPSGGLLLGGAMTAIGDEDFGVVALDNNGQIDNGFGHSGKIINRVGDKGDYAYGVALLPDGRMVLAGHIKTAGAHYAPAIVRYMPYPSGVEEVLVASVNVYPNPVHGELMLRSEEAIQEVALYNAVGQLVLHSAAGGQRSARLAVGQLPTGVYVVRVNGQYVNRIVKQ